MSIQAAKEELMSLTDFQREIHVITDEMEEISSNFHKNFIKSTWYSSLPMKLKSSIDSEDIVYHVNNSFHFLMYTYMRFILPPIKVKPELKGKVRIAWCHNVGTNIVEQAVFKEDDDKYHTWDNVWADIYFQFFQDGGASKREIHNIGIGNVKCLEDWCESLPTYSINVDQPWFYSMDTALAFPIFYKNSQTRAEHRYTFKKKLTDLLRVQILGKDGKWKDATQKIYRYLDINSNATIKDPELWGRYAYISNNELEWNKCKQSRIMYTKDVEVCDTPNSNKYGTIAEIDLNSPNPCLALFWMAENETARQNHNYSNYTTDSQDLYSGWDPIKTTTLKYGTTTILDNMPSDHFSIAEPRKHFPSAPCERGYHVHSYAWDSTNFHGDIGIVFTGLNAKLRCKLANTNIFTDIFREDEEEEEEEIIGNELELDELEDLKVNTESNQSFMTRARLLIMRKFTITAESEDKFKFSVR